MTNHFSLYVASQESSVQEKANHLLEVFPFIQVDQDQVPELYLELDENGLQIKSQVKGLPKSLKIDFLSGPLKHRLRQGHFLEDTLVKAVALLGKNRIPQTPVKIFDASLGLGRDAFLLAFLGAQLSACERHPVLLALFRDALERALKEKHLFKKYHVPQITTYFMDSKHYLESLKTNDLPDLIYFDPMFPEKKKSASVKKESQFLQFLVPATQDSECELKFFLNHCKYRLVVKRPKTAPPLYAKPSMVYEGKKIRFDVYLK